MDYLLVIELALLAYVLIYISGYYVNHIGKLLGIPFYQHMSSLAFTLRKHFNAHLLNTEDGIR